MSTAMFRRSCRTRRPSRQPKKLSSKRQPIRSLQASMAALSNTPNGQIGSPAKIRNLSALAPSMLRVSMTAGQVGILNTESTNLPRRPTAPLPAAQARAAATTKTAKPPLIKPSTAASASAPLNIKMSCLKCRQQLTTISRL